MVSLSTLLEVRESRYSPRPRLLVVLLLVYVCCGIFHQSMKFAKTERYIHMTHDMKFNLVIKQQLVIIIIPFVKELQVKGSSKNLYLIQIYDCLDLVQTSLISFLRFGKTQRSKNVSVCVLEVIGPVFCNTTRPFLLVQVNI